MGVFVIHVVAQTVVVTKVATIFVLVPIQMHVQVHDKTIMQVLYDSLLIDLMDIFTRSIKSTIISL